jgi:hypothetical protein
LSFAVCARYSGAGIGGFSMHANSADMRPQTASRLGEAIVRYSWVGWAIWIVFFVSILVQTGPRRFGSTFSVYLDYAGLLWSTQPVYDATTLDGFNYWPASLLVYVPVLQLSPTVAGVIVISITGSLFTYACYRLVEAMAPEGPWPVSAFAATGLLLVINIPAAWFNFKYIQAQVPMTAAMMLGAVAMMKARWLAATFWIFLAAVVKPLAVVMLLLAGALQPRMRLTLAVALLAGFLLPFLFLDFGYLSEQHRTWAMKLSRMAHVMPTDWPFQADFQTMLDSAGIVVPPQVATVVRFAAALGTLALAWRLSQAGGPRAMPFAILLLAGCYITLFGPRNEFTSFMVVTPAMTMLALLLLGRMDPRGWPLLAAVLMLGIAWEFHYGRWVKPLIVTLTYAWLIWIALVPARWRALIDGPPLVKPAASPI